MPLDKLDPKTVDRLWSRIMDNSKDAITRNVAFAALDMARYGGLNPRTRAIRARPTDDVITRGAMRATRNQMAVLAVNILNREKEIREIHLHEAAWAGIVCGDGDGVLVSGVFRDHFPDAVKTRLRYLNRAANRAQDFSFYLWKYSGRTTETWRLVRAKVWEGRTVQLHF